MVNKRFWLGMLVITLAFGMTVIGCEEEETKDTNPSPPTGLAGTAVSPTSVQLTWNSVSNADEYWVNYSSAKGFSGHKEGIYSASTTITGLIPATSYNFTVAVRNTDGYASSYSSPITVKTLAPETGSVSLSSLNVRSTTSSGQYGYTINIFLKLSEGAYWNSDPGSTTPKQWVTVTGLDVSSSRWTFSADYTAEDDTLHLTYMASLGSTISISNVTVAIDSAKLTEMKGYTNVTTTLTAGTPSSRSFTSWN